MLIVGEKAKCEKFKKFLESIGFIFDCIKVEDKKNKYSIYLEGNLNDSNIGMSAIYWYNSFYDQSEPHMITDVQFAVARYTKLLSYSLKEYSIYFNLNIYINAILGDSATETYRHFDNGIAIDDVAPEIISLDKEIKEYENDVNEETYVDNSKYMDAPSPEEIYGDDFYRYSDPQDHDGY